MILHCNFNSNQSDLLFCLPSVVYREQLSSQLSVQICIRLLKLLASMEFLERIAYAKVLPGRLTAYIIRSFYASDQ